MKQTKFGKDFTLVVIGQIISLFGNAILRFALPLYLLRQTNSPTLFGLVTACSFLPMIALSFLGGILADRVNKRNIMVTLDFGASAVIALCLLLLKNVPLVPLLLLVLMLLYGISGAYQPTVQASIPALVLRENVLTANAIVNQVGALAGLLGPIIGGMLFGAFGIVPILTISILCFASSAVMEIFIKIPFEPRDNSSGVLVLLKNDVRDSVRYMKNDQPLLIQIIVLIALFNLVLSAMMIVGIPILIVETLCLSDALLGLAQGMLALGGLCGGLLTMAFGTRLKLCHAHNLLLLCSLSVGVMALPFLWSMKSGSCYLVILGTSFAIMALATMFSVQMIAAVQMKTPPELVGKVIALMISISMCAQPLGQALYGMLFGKFAHSTGMILLCCALVAALIAAVSQKLFQTIPD
ncbi:MAG: MFS transporter [Pygmaiobacter sp.]